MICKVNMLGLLDAYVIHDCSPIFNFILPCSAIWERSPIDGYWGENRWDRNHLEFLGISTIPVVNMSGSGGDAKLFARVNIIFIIIFLLFNHPKAIFQVH